MQALPFREASFDLIWSEGAVYVMGFDAGLAQWRRGSNPAGIWRFPNYPGFGRIHRWS